MAEATLLMMLDMTCELPASACALMGVPSEDEKPKEKMSTVSATGVTEGVGELEGVPEAVMLAVCEGVAELEGVCVGVTDEVGVLDSDGAAVLDPVTESVGVCEGVGLGVGLVTQAFVPGAKEA